MIRILLSKSENYWNEFSTDRRITEEVRKSEVKADTRISKVLK
jgi:hypothetical protein